jgi:hypothetical protein
VRLKVALANIDDAWLLGFIIEQHSSGMLTVIIPSAPTPTAGSIYYLAEQQVGRLNVPNPGRDQTLALDAEKRAKEARFIQTFGIIEDGFAGAAESAARLRPADGERVAAERRRVCREDG